MATVGVTRVEYPPLTYEQQQLVEGALAFANDRAVWHAYRIAGGNPRKVRDLIGEFKSVAYHGLCIAAVKYKPELGWEFLTYAGYWVRQAIGRRVEELHPLGAGACRKGASWRVQRIGQPINGHDGLLLDVPGRAAGRDVGAEGIGPELGELLRLVPTDRYRAMLVLHLVDGQTLKEVGEVFGITKERVRQIIGKVVAKLQRDPRARQLALRVLGPENMSREFVA